MYVTKIIILTYSCLYQKALKQYKTWNYTFFFKDNKWKLCTTSMTFWICKNNDGF